MTKNIAILGSTGSIGTNALRVIDGLGSGYRVSAITAHTSMELLAEQALRFKPDFVGITSEDHVDRFSELAGDYAGTVLCGPDSMSKIVQLEQVNLV